jgi:hypothetical protein
MQRIYGGTPDMGLACRRRARSNAEIMLVTADSRCPSGEPRPVGADNAASANGMRAIPKLGIAHK